MVEKRYGIKENEARAFLRMVKTSPQKLNLISPFEVVLKDTLSSHRFTDFFPLKTNSPAYEQLLSSSTTNFPSLK